MPGTHRRTISDGLDVYHLTPPFSIFDHIEDNYQGCDSIRRLFSVARAAGAESLVIESIQPTGIILEENEDIAAKFPHFVPGELFRLSFWHSRLPLEGPPANSEGFLGYAIVKRDPEVRGANFYEWHVFEAVFPKYQHPHNCHPRPQTYTVRVGEGLYSVEGLLYCQQNSLNKACAQVAIRSLLSRLLADGDISYRRINELAEPYKPGFIWGKGLTIQQIRGVFMSLNLRFNDVLYPDGDDKLRKELPYQKYAYAGLESGGGAMVGFRLAGDDRRHIIPVYGHTFNKDTWVPDANVAYFELGADLGYIPSESWTSSFIAHDDNFGPNFCIPRLYIENPNVFYILELYQPGVLYSGVKAEGVALGILGSLLRNNIGRSNRWLVRLQEWTRRKRVVLRSQSMSKDEYIEHLQGVRDWEDNRESPEFCSSLEKSLPDLLWVIEVSTPQLFPANERKLGEILLDATKPLEDESYGNVFVAARFPSVYMFGGVMTDESSNFTVMDSQLQSHTPLIRI